MAGNLFGTTRTVQPGVSGASPGRPSASTSGGVMASCPSQNGHVAASAMRVVRPSAPGRAERPGATTTGTPVSGLRRRSTTAYSGRGVPVSACSRSMGIGSTVVELFVPEISISVCR